jgi:hypothetical protein
MGSSQRNGAHGQALTSGTQPLEAAHHWHDKRMQRAGCLNRAQRSSSTSLLLAMPVEGAFVTMRRREVVGRLVNCAALTGALVVGVEVGESENVGQGTSS